jgi:hypothetical protein
MGGLVTPQQNYSDPVERQNAPDRCRNNILDKEVVSATFINI